MPLAGAANQIAVVGARRHGARALPERRRRREQRLAGALRHAVERALPRHAADRRATRASPATGNQALLDVEAGEPGLPELIPGLDVKPPVLSRVSLSRRRVQAGPRGRERVRFRVSEPATVSFRVERRGGGRWSEVKSFTRRRKAGRGSVAFRARGLRAGRHRVVVRAQDSSRNRSKRAIRRFRVVH